MNNTVQHQILTIGHSNHSLHDFIKLLVNHKVKAVVDVRSIPQSRFNPQFNCEQLERDLKVHRIRYVFSGHELGARSKDPSHYEDGRVQYSRLAKTNFFQRALKQLVRDATKNRIALMCAESEPLECHRTLLVARALVNNYNVAVAHILPNGLLESYDDAMERLLCITKRSEDELFLSRQERIAEAVTFQERRVAYKREKPTE